MTPRIKRNDSKFGSEISKKNLKKKTQFPSLTFFQVCFARFLHENNLKLDVLPSKYKPLAIIYVRLVSKAC